MKRVILPIVLAVLILTFFFITLNSRKTARIDEPESINLNDLRKHVEFLASPEMEGREAGYRGAEVAARYIAAHFHSCGLDTLNGAGDYYQNVPLIAMRPDLEKTRISFTRRKQVKFIIDKDVFFLPRAGDDGDISAGVALCGYGISAPEYDYDDYQGIDVKGKVVLVMNSEPRENDSTSVFKGRARTKYSIPLVKARTAQANGAEALLIIRTPVESQPPIERMIMRYRKRLEKPIIQLAGQTEAMPIFYLTDSAANRLLKGIVDIKEYHAEIDREMRGNPVELEGVDLNIRIRFKEKRTIESPNVIGFLPGSNPSLQDEYLIIGAHYDHEGMSAEGVFPGADDNASGVAGLLELAEAFSKSPAKPQRSILFISFAAEEKGTLGSKYYSQNPLLPLENAITMINMDEIGRNGASTFGEMHSPDLEEEGKNYLMTLYSAQAPILEEINAGVNKIYGLKIDFDPNTSFYGASDHVNFHKQDIPCIFYFTGFHPDYSSVNDTPDKINYPKMERIVRLIYGVSDELLNLESKPFFDHSIKEVPKKKRMSF